MLHFSILNKNKKEVFSVKRKDLFGLYKDFHRREILAFLFLQIERIRAVPSVRWFLSLPLTAAFDKILSRIFSFCMGKLLYLFELYHDICPSSLTFISPIAIILL